ncbi:hypothetical protein G9A89_006392 [Geosiphon pyriformis]|nr:hypothetical protein G9A89_006392 [Geosiphon pyriformis]
MYLKSTFSVFALAPVMAPASQMAAISFASQQPPYQRQQNHGPPVCYCCRLTGHFSRDCNNSPPLPPAFRNNNNQNNKTINNNVLNQRLNHANINFFEENLLVEATDESTSQPEENFFYAFNLTNNNHDMEELAINTSELTRKKKKAKVDFIIDPKKASILTADNNKLPKTKVFKNLPKLEPPKIVQKFGLYSVVKDLMETPIHITFGQLMTHLQFRKNFHKLLIPKKKTPKTNKQPHQAEFADNSNVTSLICKAQVAGYFIDLIITLSTQPITNVHSNKKKGLSIAKAISVYINGISIETDMEVSEVKEYTIIKVKALLDYELCELTIRCSEKPIVQNQEEEQSDKSNDDKSDKKKDQKEQKETAELVYIIFTSNGKPLNNVKANKERIMQNTVISGMVLVPDAGAINLCIPLVMNASPA